MPYTKYIIRKPRVKEVDLSKENALGFAYQDDFEIEIEPNQSSKEYLNTLIHEMLHCFFPELKENQITKLADIMAENIWKKSYRRIKK